MAFSHRFPRYIPPSADYQAPRVEAHAKVRQFGCCDSNIDPEVTIHCRKTDTQQGQNLGFCLEPVFPIMYVDMPTAFIQCVGTPRDHLMDFPCPCRDVANAVKLDRYRFLDSFAFCKFCSHRTSPFTLGAFAGRLTGLGPRCFRFKPAPGMPPYDTSILWCHEI